MSGAWAIEEKHVFMPFLPQNGKLCCIVVHKHLSFYVPCFDFFCGHLHLIGIDSFPHKYIFVPSCIDS
jgi:hypothetical protein